MVARRRRRFLRAGRRAWAADRLRLALGGGAASRSRLLPELHARPAGAEARQSRPARRRLPDPGVAARRLALPAGRGDRGHARLQPLGGAGRVSVRELGPEETGLAYQALLELRPGQGSEADFVGRVNELQRPEGYRLVASFAEGQPAAVAA